VAQGLCGQVSSTVQGGALKLQSALHSEMWGIQESLSMFVRARHVKGGPEWKITSCVFHHRCRGKDFDVVGLKDDHHQLTSKFIAHRFAASIKILPTYPIKVLIEMAQ
jgi:hypothetical protein